MVFLTITVLLFIITPIVTGQQQPSPSPSPTMYPFPCSKTIPTCKATLYHSFSGHTPQQLASFYSVPTSDVQPLSRNSREDYIITVPCSCLTVTSTTAYFYPVIYPVQQGDTFSDVSSEIYRGQVWVVGNEAQRFVAGDNVTLNLLCGCEGDGRGEIVTYTVENGDTLSDIGHRFHASLASMVSLNQLLGKDTAFIDVGWVLYVPQGSQGVDVGAGDQSSSKSIVFVEFSLCTTCFFHIIVLINLETKISNMAGSLAVVVHQSEEENAAATERSESGAGDRKWKVLFSRFVHFPTVSASSHPTSLSPVRAKRHHGVRGTWISTSSPTTLQLVDDSSCSDTIISVSLQGRVLEEHYVSKLHFSWPQVSCTAGYPPRGTRSVFVSFKDTATLIHKFAFQFSTVSESESFIATLKELLEYPITTEPLASDLKSDISTHSAMMSTEMPTSRDFVGESSTMSPFNAYSPVLPPSTSNEVPQDPIPEETSLTHNTNISTLTMPPSFTSLLSNCCPAIQKATGIFKLTDDDDLKSQIAKYMEDSSFQDMLFKVEKIIGETGGDPII
ncbi:Protein POOR HOMOLOGOUS SYNAPSIS 1 [Linum perenne]